MLEYLNLTSSKVLLHVNLCTAGKKGIYVKCAPPELSVLADGHHDQQISQDAHQHDQRQEADEGHPLWHAVAMETPKRQHNKNNTLVQICRVEHSLYLLHISVMEGMKLS